MISESISDTGGDIEPDDGDDVLAFTVPADKAGERIDRFLAGEQEDLSRSRIKQLILDGAVSVAGTIRTDPSAKVRADSIITLIVPPAQDDTPIPENIPLEIIYEDEDLLVLNKPAGMVVHTAPGHYSGTLVNALLYHCGDSLSGIGGVRRPGIVHRLDKDTTGLMMVAKNDRAHQGLSAQLADRSLSRIYKALVWGAPSLGKGVIDAPIGRHSVHRQKMAVNVRGARRAVTHYRVEKNFGGGAALIECHLETGRTHQIRVHLAHHGYPVIGDPVYGAQPTKALSLMNRAGYDKAITEKLLAFPRQALHAQRISFIHPATGDRKSFEVGLPADMEEILYLL